MTEEIIREYHVSTLRGKVEDVPIADGVDMEEIRRSDADPMFVSLPIAELGAISNNGLLYDDALISSIEQQINANRPGGIFGHLKEDERSTAFPLPAGLWVGAKLFGETLWAKSYVPPSAARDYVRNLKAVGGQIATSIYGRTAKFEKVRDGVKRAINFKLESLDFAPPGRAALGMGAVPHLTSEMEIEQEPIMADKAQVIAELTVADIPAPLRDAIVAEASKQDETQATIAELTSTVEAKEATIAEMQATIAEYRKAAVSARITELVSEGVKLVDARDMVMELIEARAPKTVEEAEAVYAQVIEMASVKKLLALTVQSLSGPAAIVNGKVSDTGGRKPLDDTPENRARAAAAMGINI